VFIDGYGHRARFAPRAGGFCKVRIETGFLVKEGKADTTLSEVDETHLREGPR